LTYAFARLGRRGTWLTALAVGSLINVYGQLVVPWLRGSSAPWRDVVDAWRSDPGVVGLSVVLGFVFPLVVGVFSSTATYWQHRRALSRAEFPDRKPDPVFRARPDGRIVEAGEQTERWMRARSLFRAQDIFGSRDWNRIAQRSASDALRVAHDGRDLLVRSAGAGRDAESELLNVYVTEVPAYVQPAGAA
jgi:hypothetical protein